MESAIVELLERYCARMDAADWTGVGALFREGRLADESGAELARGADAISEFFRRGTLLHDGSPRTKHIVVPIAAEPTDLDVATVHSGFLVLQGLGDEPMRPIAAGRYRDVVRRTDSGWTFDERRFSLDLAGDLSGHLVQPPFRRP